jgi:hypothetical protein
MRDHLRHNLFWITISIVILLLAMYGGDKHIPANRIVTQDTEEYSDPFRFRVLVMDGCEYVSFGHGLAHKGNCTNKIHIYKLENHH